MQPFTCGTTAATCWQLASISACFLLSRLWWRCSRRRSPQGRPDSPQVSVFSLAAVQKAQLLRPRWVQLLSMWHFFALQIQQLNQELWNPAVLRLMTVRFLNNSVWCFPSPCSHLPPPHWTAMWNPVPHVCWWLKMITFSADSSSMYACPQEIVLGSVNVFSVTLSRSQKQKQFALCSYFWLWEEAAMKTEQTAPERSSNYVNFGILWHFHVPMCPRKNGNVKTEDVRPASPTFTPFNNVTFRCSALRVLLCAAVARGLIQPLTGPDRVKPTPPGDKGRNRADKGTQKTPGGHEDCLGPAALQDAHKALEVCRCLHSVVEELTVGWVKLHCHYCPPPFFIWHSHCFHQPFSLKCQWTVC